MLVLVLVVDLFKDSLFQPKLFAPERASMKVERAHQKLTLGLIAIMIMIMIQCAAAVHSEPIIHGLVFADWTIIMIITTLVPKLHSPFSRSNTPLLIRIGLLQDCLRIETDVSSIDRAPNDTKNIKSTFYYHFRRASPLLSFCLLLQSFSHSNKPLSCIFNRNHELEYTNSKTSKTFSLDKASFCSIF
jgi:hypothetical protein